MKKVIAYRLTVTNKNSVKGVFGKVFLLVYHFYAKTEQVSEFYCDFSK